MKETPPAFDPIDFSRRLASEGMAREQADILSSAFGKVFAEILDTRASVEDLRRDVGEAKEDLRRDVRETKKDLVIWLGGAIAVGITILAVLQAYLSA